MSAESDLLVVMPRDLLRDGVCSAIAEHSDITVTACADSSKAAESARRLQPAAVLLALELGDRRNSGFDLKLCRAILTASPRSKLLCLADQPTPQLVDLARRAGARDVFDLDLSLELLSATLQQMTTGSGATPVADPSPLTSREHTVLVLLAQGYDHRAIADELFVSPHTARTHIRNVMQKLGAHNRLEAVHLATDTGLLDQPAG